MKITRRNALLTTLFGVGGVGLRALATGLPVSFFLNPREALADPTCQPNQKPQYIIMSTSGLGDPINASAPGTYEDPKIIHSPDITNMGPTALTLAGKPYTAAKPWAQLPQTVLDRTVFWHLMTNTPVHPNEPQVLELMGLTENYEMLPSLLATAVAPCLSTVQNQPVCVGASSPSEALKYQGQALPIIPPLALAATLTNPAGPLTDLQALRDQSMGQIYDIYKNAATPPQQAYIDQMVTSQSQVRSLNQSLLNTLSSISDNSVASQITAAVTLIQMNICPLVSIHIPFGGDNHSDPALGNESAQTVSGVASIASLMAQLQAAQFADGTSLIDKVTFMSLNVFGRTLATNAGGDASNGRGHNPNHQVSITIGKPFTGGVIGACAPVGNDYGCTAIDSSTGMGGSGGDIAPALTLASFGRTMLSSVGGDSTLVSAGKVITPALSGM